MGAIESYYVPDYDTAELWGLLKDNRAHRSTRTELEAHGWHFVGIGKVETDDKRILFYQRLDGDNRIWYEELPKLRRRKKRKAAS